MSKLRVTLVNRFKTDTDESLGFQNTSNSKVKCNTDESLGFQNTPNTNRNGHDGEGFVMSVRTQTGTKGGRK